MKDADIPIVISDLMMPKMNGLEFIKKAKEHGEFLAIRVTTTAVKNPLSTTSESELSQLAQHAIHYARALENELSSIVGCGEIADITDEVLIRLELG